MKLKGLRVGLAALCTVAIVGCGSDAASDDAKGGDKAAKGTRELVVTAFGGDYEKAQQQALFSKFEKEHDVKIKTVTIYSADALAKLTAAGGNAGFDVVQFSGGQEVQAAQNGLLEKIEASELENAAQMFPQALQEGYAPAYAFDVAGFISREGTEPVPDSWDAIGDPRLKGRIAVPDISNTYGVQTLIGLAEANGGSIENVQPGFDALKRAKGNIHSFFKDAPTMVQLLSRKEIDVGIYDSIYAFLMQKQGIPVRFSVPKEGSFLTKVTMNVVKDSENRDLAVKLIDMALDPKVQAEFAEESGSVPTNKDAEVTGPAAKLIATPEEIGRLKPIDDAYVAKNRSAWTATWNRTIAK